MGLTDSLLRAETKWNIPCPSPFELLHHLSPFIHMQWMSLVIYKAKTFIAFLTREKKKKNWAHFSLFTSLLNINHGTIKCHCKACHSKVYRIKIRLTKTALICISKVWFITNSGQEMNRKLLRDSSGGKLFFFFCFFCKKAVSKDISLQSTADLSGGCNMTRMIM